MFHHDNGSSGPPMVRRLSSPPVVVWG